MIELDIVDPKTRDFSRQSRRKPIDNHLDDIRLLEE